MTSIIIVNIIIVGQKVVYWPNEIHATPVISLYLLVSSLFSDVTWIMISLTLCSCQNSVFFLQKNESLFTIFGDVDPVYVFCFGHISKNYQLNIVQNNYYSSYG